MTSEHVFKLVCIYFDYKLKNINNNIAITNRNNIGNKGTITESSEDDGSNYDENNDV